MRYFRAQLQHFAKTFGSEDALKEYLRTHPGADPKKHKVDRKSRSQSPEKAMSKAFSPTLSGVGEKDVGSPATLKVLKDTSRERASKQLAQYLAKGAKGKQMKEDKADIKKLRKSNPAFKDLAVGKVLDALDRDFLAAIDASGVDVPAADKDKMARAFSLHTLSTTMHRMVTSRGKRAFTPKIRQPLHPPPGMEDFRVLDEVIGSFNDYRRELLDAFELMLRERHDPARFAYFVRRFDRVLEDQLELLQKARKSYTQMFLKRL